MKIEELYLIIFNIKINSKKYFKGVYLEMEKFYQKSKIMGNI